MNRLKFKRGGTIFDGPAAESLFTTPYFDGVRFLEQERPPWLTAMEGTDDRSCALVGMLMVEARIESLLQLWLPGFDVLGDIGGHQMILLLKATKLIPSKFHNGADAVRQVRNRFAHRVDLERFADVPRQINKDAIVELKRFRMPRAVAGALRAKPPAIPHDPRRVFESLVHLLCLGMFEYEVNVRTLRGVIGHPKLARTLRAEAEHHHVSILKAMGEQK